MTDSPLPLHTAPLPQGTMVAGRYRIEELIDSGGMSNVYRAVDTQVEDRIVALKMLPPALAQSKRAVAEFVAEARHLLAVQHPNIVPFRGFDKSRHGLFIVTDFIRGQTLAQLLDKEGILTEREVLRIIEPLAGALDYAHSQRLLHRDIKPSNILISNVGTPYLLDFGIARQAINGFTREQSSNSVGTLPYMSPEQLNGDLPSRAQDVYSLAATMYECLAGHPPFYQGQIENQILKRNPDPPHAENTPFSRSILRGLSKNPADRPPTCRRMLGLADINPAEDTMPTEAFLTALQPLASGKKVPDVHTTSLLPESLAKPAAKKTLLITAGVVAVLLIVGVLGIMFGTNMVENSQPARPASGSSVQQAGMSAPANVVPTLIVQPAPQATTPTEVAPSVNGTPQPDRVVEPAGSTDVQGGRWTVLFRSDDPSRWNTDVNAGNDDRAVPLSQAPLDTRWLRLTRVDTGEYVIIPMEATNLGKVTTVSDNIVWVGTGALDSRRTGEGVVRAHRKLGIANRTWHLAYKADDPVVLTTSSRRDSGAGGWGFGQSALAYPPQRYAWAGKSVDQMVYEVAVSSNDLTAVERSQCIVPVASTPAPIAEATPVASSPSPVQDGAVDQRHPPQGKYMLSLIGDGGPTIQLHVVGDTVRFERYTDKTRSRPLQTTYQANAVKPGVFRLVGDEQPEEYVQWSVTPNGLIVAQSWHKRDTFGAGKPANTLGVGHLLDNVASPPSSPSPVQDGDVDQRHLPQGKFELSLIGDGGPTIQFHIDGDTVRFEQYTDKTRSRPLQTTYQVNVVKPGVFGLLENERSQEYVQWSVTPDGLIVAQSWHKRETFDAGKPANTLGVVRLLDNVASPPSSPSPAQNVVDQLVKHDPKAIHRMTVFLDETGLGYFEVDSRGETPTPAKPGVAVRQVRIEGFNNADIREEGNRVLRIAHDFTAVRRLQEITDYPKVKIGKNDKASTLAEAPQSFQLATGNGLRMIGRVGMPYSRDLQLPIRIDIEFDTSNGVLYIPIGVRGDHTGALFMYVTPSTREYEVWFSNAVTSDGKLTLQRTDIAKGAAAPNKLTRLDFKVDLSEETYSIFPYIYSQEPGKHVTLRSVIVHAPVLPLGSPYLRYAGSNSEPPVVYDTLLPAGTLLKDDVIVRVNDNAIATHQQFIDALSTLSFGDTAKLGVRRNGREMEVDVKVP